MIFGLTVTSHATLIDRGGGLVYDTDLTVTWLQDANYARTTGYTTSGFNYDDAVAWVDQLVYAGFDNWRHLLLVIIHNRVTIRQALS